MKYVVVAFHVGDILNAHYSILVQYNNDDVTNTTLAKYRSALRLALRWSRDERHPVPLGLYNAALEQNMTSKNFKLNAVTLGTFRSRELAKNFIKEHKTKVGNNVWTKVDKILNSPDICDSDAAQESNICCDSGNLPSTQTLPIKEISEMYCKAWAIKELKEVIFDRIINHDDSTFSNLEFTEDEIFLVRQLIERWS